MTYNKENYKLPTVDLIFNCYERTYSYALTEQFINKTINDNHFRFNNVFVVINDVDNRPHVEKIAQNLKDRRIIDDFFFVEDYIDKVLSIVKLKKKDLGRNYHYIDWALVTIYIAKSKYVLHWDENVKLIKSDNWIVPSLKEFEKNPRIFSAIPKWENYDKTEELTNYENNQFCEDFFFSDLVFLVRKSAVLKPIYKYRHIRLFLYPLYFVAPTFESMLGGFMLRNNRVRIVYKNAVYIHELEGLYYPKYTFLEKVKRFLQNRILYLYNIIFDYRTNRYRPINQIILNLKSILSLFTIRKFFDYRVTYMH